jgi:hypothetical protein
MAAQTKAGIMVNAAGAGVEKLIPKATGNPVEGLRAG